MDSDELISPFSKYLRTNDVPSELQTTQLLGLLKKPKEVVASLDEQIARLQSMLESTKKQKRGLDETIEGHNQLLSPFRSLPDDMITEIFFWCLPDEHNAIMDAKEPPLLLGRVCSRWRSLAYHTPRLWATLQMSWLHPPTWNLHNFWVPPEKRSQISIEFEALLQVHLGAVQNWLDRSRSLPLSIAIIDLVHPRYSHLDTTRYIAAYLNIVLASSHRWRCLEISLPDRNYPPFLESILSGSLPCLEYLYVRFPPNRLTTVKMWTNGSFFNAKKLRVLHLRQNPFFLSQLNIDWTQITHLTMTTLTSLSRLKKIKLEDAFVMLRCCRRLQGLVFEVFDTDQTFSPSSMISLPLLESLAVIDEAHKLGTLLACLDVPVLTEVTYYTAFLPATTERSPLIDLLQRTNNRVKSLTISLHFHTVADIIQCLELVPSLTHFTNSLPWSKNPNLQERCNRLRAQWPFSSRVTKAFLDFFLPSSAGPGFCPKLHTLNLKESLGLTDHDALLFLKRHLEASKALEPNMDPVDRLVCVNIILTDPMTVDVPACLKQYVDEGLKLSISFPPLKQPQHGKFFIDPRAGLQLPLLDTNNQR